MKYTIYIPTKGRAGITTTPQVFDSEGLNYKLVVEPQDYAKYLQFFPQEKIIVMGRDNVGMAGVRRFIKEYSINEGEKYHWQIDDNIKGFKIRLDNKNIPSTAGANIEKIETFVDQYSNIGIAGMRHIMYAWAQKTDHTFNQQCPSCVLFNNRIKSIWRDDVIEDTDFALQVLTEGFVTILFNRIVMDKLPMKTLPGGCTDLYYINDNIRYARQLRLQELWPGVFEIKVKNGVSRVKPSKVWRRFTQKLIKNE